MSYLNKIVISFLIGILSIGSAFADANKDYLLGEINSLQTKLNTLKTSKTTELETKVLDLTSKFDAIFNELGYDSKTVNYLVSLGKITSNFKTDLVNDLSALKADINTQVSKELSTLDSLKDNITFKYTTVSDSEKAKFVETITTINTNYTNINDTVTTKIAQLNTKYSSNLDGYKANLKSAFEANKGSIDSVKAFDTNFNTLYTLEEDFQKNYEIFKKAYLSYAGDLKTFSNTKQNEYVQTLKADLEKLRDANIEANKGLATYKGEIDRLIDLLVENFKNSLSAKVNDNYGVIYSDTDVNSILNRYTELKNKYYDSDSNVKAQAVLSNTGTTEEISFLKSKLSEINTNIKNLIGGDTADTVTINNIQVRLENEMVKFYNDNYQSFRADLLAKLKEKLDLNALETKNALLASDSIDLRYSLVSDKISKSNDLNFIQEQISGFKKDVEKYSYLNNETLNKKTKKLNNNLDIFITSKELSNTKYSKYSKLGTSYDNSLNTILIKLKSKYPTTYEAKLTVVLAKIDALLTQKLNDKTRFSLLVIKKSILTWLNNQ